MQEVVRSKDVVSELDPITLEVIRHGLVSITNQIDANIKRTAFSPYIYEYNDFAVGLVGADGQLIAQCTGGMPPFVADSVGMAVRDGLQIYGKARLHHGDVVLVQPRRRAGPAPQQHGDVHADLCRARAHDADRLLRHQRALDRDRRHPEPIRPTSSWRACSSARSSCGRRASRSRRSTASSRTTRACRTS